MESSLCIAADLENLSAIRSFVQEAAETFDGDPSAIPDVLLAVDEAATNIIIHGYQGQPGSIEIEVSRVGDALVICLLDHAPPFDPTVVPPPDLTLSLEQRPIGGLGIHLIRQLVDELTHRVTPQGGNQLTLVKRGFIDRQTTY